MSNELLLPVGRLVGGSVYKPKTTDAENNPLIIKTGPNAGQPRVEFYIGVAIAKGIETDWKQTPWGQTINSVALAGFPQGQTNLPGFAWKVTDGDSVIPNTRGVLPNSRTGYVGNWVLHLSSAFAPQLYNADGSKPLTEPGAIKCGYYVQVFGTVNSNGSQNQPGVYLNHNYVALSGYGDEISNGPDPAAVGFGGVLPAGASSTPLAAIPPTGAGAPIPPAVVAPTPPAARVMLPAANGLSYESYTAAGWTDQQLISSGMMQA